MIERISRERIHTETQALDKPTSGSAHQVARVSVVVIFFNAERYLQEAIDSVFSQTVDEWELLLVDDGSTDRSTEIAKAVAAAHPRKVRYFEHEGHINRGKSASRNLGIREATGEYVAFLDADDVWLPNKLREQVQLLDSKPDAAMLYGPTEYWSSWTDSGCHGKDSRSKVGVAPNTLVQPPHLLCLMLHHERRRNETICPYPSSVIVRRSVFQEIGGFEEDFRDLYDDVVFFAKVFLKAPVFVAGSCWDKYRMRPEHKFSHSYTNAIRSGHWHPSEPNNAELAFLTWLERYVSAQKLPSFRLRKAIAESLLPYRNPLLHEQLRRAENFMISLKKGARQIGRKILPLRTRHPLRVLWRGREATPSVGEATLGALRRLTPISRQFGYDRGTPIDRYYIERFLAAHSSDIRGRVLEIGDNSYTRRFGGQRVATSDVLHRLPGNPSATIVGDLSRADHIPDRTFDCVILTQTLLCIYDVRAAVRTLRRILKPGGVVLATVPGICQIAQPDMQLWGDYWRFTTLSTRKLFEEFFPADNVTIASHGNILVAIAFLHGLAMEELQQEELDHCDPDYQVNITVRAVCPEENE